ncbi:hypothetical protein FPF71_04990 [Algibacter amylolyticus]|uniref:Lipoprotein n=2 Tax=Algibacter amylolyticus TaxID=1608400 RepID=A0A5M7BNW5_9FLAO|nr:hypothetical protein [Algibacter amylolyticus]KAA5828195.1 hypothetical protein F2B50_04990 [Algibacter amylolyticus]MBB5267446.1 hypothetical protein [Algibacter amylolyticus]TSJ82440.1 hypothetical protein FPF71_04990 [Algibacter amylolyticus]
MKTVITLIFVLILSSCASKKNAESKGKSEYTFEQIVQDFDSKKVKYIGMKKYCVGSVRLNTINPKDCANCFSDNDIYIFWNENGKSYVQKFDNCSEFNRIEIFDFQPSEFLNNNSKELLTEKVGRFQIDDETYSTISHSCFRSFILNDGQSKFENKFDNYDLTGENKNLNYKANNELKIIMLEKELNKIITELENDNRFERDKKTCYNMRIKHTKSRKFIQKQPKP